MKEVTPVGVEEKIRLSTVKAPSRVVAMTGPTAFAVLKLRVSVRPGRTVEGAVPLASSDQLARVLHEAPVTPLK